MKLAFSTNAFTRFRLVEAIRHIHSAGFEGVEILADTPHAYPDAIGSDLIFAIRRALNDTGLAVSNLNCNCSFGYWKDAPPEPYFEPSLISPNPMHRVDRQRLILKSMELAREFGSPCISITSGRMLAGMPPEKSAAQLAESIKPILEQAERMNLDVGIECEPGLFIEYVAELKEWIDKLGSDRLGANLDIGHCQVIGESIPAAVRLLAGRIWNMHVEDIPGRKHYHMIPGEGTIDWQAFKSAVEEIKYDRFLSVELYTQTTNPTVAAVKSRHFLGELFG